MYLWPHFLCVFLCQSSLSLSVYLNFESQYLYMGPHPYTDVDLDRVLPCCWFRQIIAFQAPQTLYANALDKSTLRMYNCFMLTVSSIIGLQYIHTISVRHWRPQNHLQQLYKFRCFELLHTIHNFVAKYNRSHALSTT